MYNKHSIYYFYYSCFKKKSDTGSHSLKHLSFGNRFQGNILKWAQKSPNETETLVSNCHMTPTVMSEDKILKSTR